VATVLVVILSLLFRMGIKKERSLELRAGSEHLDEITQFMEDQGSAWGMRKEIVTRATDAAYEVVNNLGLLPLRSEIITLNTSWDELRLDLDIEYAGPAIELASSMPAMEEMGTEAGAAHLAGYLIRQYADRVKIREKNGVCRVSLHFDH
jgi:NCS2 family nucleobase:cation symporter-2